MDERQLLIEYKTFGSIQALQTLTLLHKPFVHYIANNYSRDPNLYDDIVQEGILGLIHAINKFDLKYTTKLITYAKYWIREYISKYLRSYGKKFKGVLESALQYSPEDIVIRKNISDRIYEAKEKVLKNSNSREIEIFNARFVELDEVSYEELGTRYGVSRQRIEQISSRTIDKIRGEL